MGLMQKLAGILMVWATSCAVHATEAVVQVELSRVSNSEFRVKYRFPMPIKEFEFKQSPAQLSDKGLSFITSGLEYAENKIRTKGTSSFQEAEFSLTRPKMVLRQYDPLIHFTSAGTAAYSENLVLKKEQWITEFRLRPSSNERSFIAGSTSEIAAASGMRADPASRGAYLYIGTIAPVQAGKMVYFADPALPHWVREDFVRTAESTLSYFSDELGTPQPLHPVFFLTMDGLDDAGRNYRGDTLPAQFIRLNLFGGGWIIKNETKQNQLRKLIAHEIFHLWNAEFYAADHDHPWMHEGGADYFALKSLLARSLISRQYAIDAMNTALNNCLTDQMQSNLASVASQTTAQRLYYDCGSFIYYLAEKGFNNKNEFYHAVFDGKTQASSPQRFVRHLAEKPELLTLVSLIDDLESGAGVPLGRKIREQLHAQGIRYETSPFDIAGPVYSQALLSSVIGADCQGVGYWALEAGIKVDSNMGCKRLSGFPVITKMMNLNPVKQPKLAYEAVRKQCVTPNATLGLETDSGQRLELACGRPLPEVSPPIYISDLPW